MSFRIIVLSGLICVSCIFAGESDSLRTDSTYADSWFAPDKGRHLIGSMLMTVFLSRVCESQWDMSSGDARAIGFSVTFSLGIGKELIDGKNPPNFFSFRDLTANIAGILVGFLILGIK